MMTAAFRRLNLTAHIVFSVGWIGAAFAFFVISIVGLTSKDVMVVRGAYLSTNLICLYSIIPLSLLALATGLIQSLVTRWGLFQHYWVLAKLALTTLSIIVLLMHQFAAVAKAAKLVSAAAAGTLPQPDLAKVGFVLLRASGLGIVVLLVVTVISVYKPWGLTPYGEQRRERRRQPIADLEVSPSPRSVVSQDSAPRYRIVVVLGIVLLIIAIALLHLHGHGFYHAH